jgi:hypothetical protein
LTKTYENGFRDKAIQTLEDGLKDIKSEIADFDTRMDLRFEKFGEALKDTYVTKVELTTCLEEKITGTPLDKNKMRWQKLGIIFAVIFGALGLVTTIINLLRHP